MSTFIFTEALESRTLMSAAGGSAAVFDSAVLSDRLQIQADLLKFKTDALNSFTTLSADVAAIKADDVKAATTVLPLISKYKTDEKTMWSELKIDRLTEAQNVLTAESVVLGDKLQILKDHGNASALTTDRAKLLADRITLQNDMVAGLTARLTARQAGAATISADLTAIVTAAQSDPHASAQLVTDLTKAASDKTAGLNALTADIQSLLADRTKLAADLTAEQST